MKKRLIQLLNGLIQDIDEDAPESAGGLVAGHEAYTREEFQAMIYFVEALGDE